MSARRIVCVGEGMVELRTEADGGCHLGYGGDTLNTAIHLARLGCDVTYATALGTDTFSRRLLGEWAREGLDCSAILLDPARRVGLYAITLDEAGERSFIYWRSDSAARRMFSLSGSAVIGDVVRSSPAMAFSLISLAILPNDGRDALISLAGAVRNSGGMVAFDGNYRPALWEDAAAASYWRDRAIAASTIGLPTLDDEIALSGEATADQVAERWSTLGCGETVVKLGPLGCRLPDGERVAPSNLLLPVDTSGAGDAFDAGYLAARLAGEEVQEAARKANALAGWVITHKGAIPERTQDAPYFQFAG
ncbi:sugar kinase [Qipengyuania flava]|nr:sugar kinase [Qipengyuania flava]